MNYNPKSLTNQRGHLISKHLSVIQHHLDRENPGYTYNQRLVAMFAADAGLSFNQIRKLKKYAVEGLLIPIPNSRSQISNSVQEQHYLCREKLKLYLQSRQLEHLIISFDGATNKKRKFINLVLYLPRGEFIHLSLIREKRSSTAVNVCAEIAKELTLYGFVKEDVKCIISDSASTNIKIAKSLDVFHSRCLLHMINNVVNSFLKIAKTT